MKKLLLLAIAVNFIAVLGPELGFDALWYHLTEPKIWLMWGRIDFIPGRLMYYSAMPRLGEFLYMGGLRVLGDVGTHLINWIAGVGSAFITYKIARKYLDEKYSRLAAVIFYCTPLVGWQSGSAYVDLIRTFFESLALYFFLSKKYVFSGLAVGLAVSVKTLALGGMGVLGVMSFLEKIKITQKIKNIFKFIIPAVLVAAPWFIWAYLKTGYPFYPLGAGILDATHNLGNIWPLVPLDWWLIIYPVTFFWWDRKSLIFKYALLAFAVWFITPRTGETRFLLPYLPAFAVLAAGAIARQKKLIFIALLVAIFSIIYRGVANARLLPYLLKQETKEQYLCRRLDFSTRVFVDCDGWYAKNIKKDDLVLIKGYHNLFYVNFPFVHESWYKGEKVTHVLEYKE